MAYLKQLRKPKCRDCGKQALVQLYNWWNAPLGEYCRRCGNRALAGSQSKEREEDAMNGAPD